MNLSGVHPAAQFLILVLLALVIFEAVAQAIFLMIKILAEYPREYCPFCDKKSAGLSMDEKGIYSACRNSCGYFRRY